MTAANGIDRNVGAVQTMLRRCAGNVAAAFAILLRPRATPAQCVADEPATARRSAPAPRWHFSLR